MKNLEKYEQWLLLLFDYNEDEVVFNWDDPELYKEFQKETQSIGSDIITKSI